MARKADVLLTFSGLCLTLLLVAGGLATDDFEYQQPIQLFLAPGGGDVVRPVNATAMVTCIPSLATRQVQWISPTGEVVPSSVTERVHVEEKGNGAVALVLSLVNPMDAGVWKCELIDSQEEIRQSFVLYVTQDIAFADTEIVQEGVEGEIGTIRCEATGDPVPMIQWYHNGRQLPERSENYEYVADGLVIKTLRRKDSGEYTCSARQVSPQVAVTRSKVIRFNVLHAPIFVETRIVHYAYYYGTAELTCDVIADPPANITWTSRPTKPQEYFHIIDDTVNSSTLKVSVDDPVVIGKYTCIATNFLGVVEREFELRNGSKPSPPERFIVKGVNNSSVHIEVEQETEESRINETHEADVVTGFRFQFITVDNYKKYRQRKNDDLWFPQWEVNKNLSETNSYIIGGLRPNTIYKIRVASVNKAGPSDFVRDKEFATSAGGRMKNGAQGGALGFVCLWVAIVVWEKLF